jgi:hypothetical protein
MLYEKGSGCRNPEGEEGALFSMKKRIVRRNLPIFREVAVFFRKIACGNNV